MDNAIVIKTGSGLLAGSDNQLNLQMVERIVAEVAALREAGKHVAIVSSGAVASGRTVPALQGGFPVPAGDRRAAKILREQILAAVGQPMLMRAYQRAFQEKGLVCAQILVTRSDFADKVRYLNLRTVVTNLLGLGIVPIVNENDVLSTEEIDELDFTDNDQLGCMMAAMLGAELLLVLTTVPGVMDRHPGDPQARVVEEVTEVDEVRELVQEGEVTGKGGMASKLEAADLITSLGIPMRIVSGFEPQAITRVVLKGERLGTFFPAQRRKVSRQKAWIGSAAATRGKIVVSTYLADLLRARRFASILLRGVETVGEAETFQKGDVVSVFDDQGQELGRGQVRYSALELRALLQERQAEHERTGGGQKLVIHYDYFVPA